MRHDGDFVTDLPCIGRSWMPRWFRAWCDLSCWALGHNLWRVMNSRRRPADGSLDVYATYCRRCLKGGYIKGDYAP